LSAFDKIFVNPPPKKESFGSFDGGGLSSLADGSALKVDPRTKSLEPNGFESALPTLPNGELEVAGAGVPKRLVVVFCPNTLPALFELWAADANPPVEANEANPPDDAGLLDSTCDDDPKG